VVFQNIFVVSKVKPYLTLPILFRRSLISANVYCVYLQISWFDMWQDVGKPRIWSDPGQRRQRDHEVDEWCR